MAFNPPIASNGVPLRVEQEFFILYRNEIEGQFKIKNMGKFSSTGIVYITTCRMVFVSDKYRRDIFKSFDIPLAYLSAEKFQQPIFGNNYLKGDVDPLYNLLPGRTHFKLIFKAGGCDKFLKIFVSMLQQIRKQRSTGQRVPDALIMENFARAQSQAYSDPTDPSVIYVQQPQVGQQSYGNKPLSVPQNQNQVSLIVIPNNQIVQQQYQQSSMNQQYQQRPQGYQQQQQNPQGYQQYQQNIQGQLQYQQNPQGQRQYQQNPQGQQQYQMNPQGYQQYQQNPQGYQQYQQNPGQNFQNTLQKGIPVNYLMGYQQQPQINYTQPQMQQPQQSNNQPSIPYIQQNPIQPTNPQVQPIQQQQQQQQQPPQTNESQPSQEVNQNQVPSIQQNQNLSQPSQEENTNQEEPIQNNDQEPEDQPQPDQVRNQPNTAYYFGIWGPQLQSNQNEIL